MKKLTFLLYALLLMLACEPSARAAYSGSWGGVTMTLSDDGTLTLSGSGSLSKLPHEYLGFSQSSVTAIVIGSGITGLPSSCFQSYTAVTSVTFEATCQITTIPNSCFHSCTSLTSITIPSSVSIIDDYAFNNCTSLGPTITIPSTVNSIGRNAFCQCSSFTTLIIEDNSDLCFYPYAFGDVQSLVTIVCKCTTPPCMCDSDNSEVFNWYTYQNAQLYLPSAYIDAYLSAAQSSNCKVWSGFSSDVLDNYKDYSLYGETTISIDDDCLTITYGDTFNESCITTNSDGDMTVTYYDADGCSGNEITSPTDAGTYSIYVHVDESTGGYFEASECFTLTILPATIADGIVTISDISVTFGSTYSIAYSASKYALGFTPTVTISYYDSDGGQVASLPEDAGTYSACITVSDPNGNYYDKTVCATITITQAENVISGLSDQTITYGDAAVKYSLACYSGDAVTLTYYTDADHTLGATTTQPTDAGTYYLLATSPATDNFYASEATATLTINQADPGTLGNVTFDPDCIASLVYNGSAFDISGCIDQTGTGGDIESITYYDGSDCSTGQEIDGYPTEAGTYSALICVAANGNYTDYCYCYSFTINKADDAITLDTYTITYGQTHSLSLTSDIAQLPVTITYYTDATYKTEITAQPFAGGTYYLKATTTGDDNYNAATATSTLTVIPADPADDGKNTVDTDTDCLASFVYNGSAIDITSCLGETGTGGDIESITYYDGSDCSTGNELTGQPTNAGTYSALVCIAATEDYEGYCVCLSFTIDKAENAIYNLNSSYTITYGTTTLDLSKVTSLSGDPVEITYHTTSDLSDDGITTQPTDADTYYIRAFVEETDNYYAATKSAVFTITTSGDVQLTYNDDCLSITYGTDYDLTDCIVHTGSSCDISNIAYYEGTCDQDDGSLTTIDKPTDVGQYHAVVTVEACGNYSEYTECIDFEITKKTPTDDDGDTFTYDTDCMNSIVYGQDYDLTDCITDNPTGGDITITYYEGTNCKTGKELTDKPTSAGTYSAYICIGATDNYESYCRCVAFTINKADDAITLDDAYNIVYGQSLDLSDIVTDYGHIATTIVYYSDDAYTTLLLDDEPFDAGTYYILASSAGDDNYNPATATSTLIVTAADPANDNTNTIESDQDCLNSIVYGTDYNVLDCLGETGTGGNIDEDNITYYDGEGCQEGNELTEKPTDAGSYSFTVCVEATQNHDAYCLCYNFTINPKTPDDSEKFDYDDDCLTVTYGDDYDITNCIGESPTGGNIETITYYDGDNCTEGNELDEKPTNAGTYSVSVCIAATNNYEGYCQCLPLIIKPKTPSDEDGDTFEYDQDCLNSIVYGTDYNLIDCTSLDPSAVDSIQYFTGTDCSFGILTEKPTDADTYTALIYVAATGNYEAYSKCVTFTINPKVPNADDGETLDYDQECLDSIVYGQDYDITDCINGTGTDGMIDNITYYDGADCQTGNELTSKPTEAGTYSALIHVAATYNYEAYEQCITFTINPSGTDDMQLNYDEDCLTGIIYGQDYDVRDCISDTGTGGEIDNLTYYDGTDCSGDILDSKPTNSGSYSVLVHVAATNNYEAYEQCLPLTISKADSEAEFDLNGQYRYYIGDEQPDFYEHVTNTNGADVTVTYIDSDGNEFDTFPTEVGQYQVIITVAETDNYLGTEATTKLKVIAAQFHIMKAFSPNGDGYNDVFKINLPDEYSANSLTTIKIFNRWGTMVFQSHGEQYGRDCDWWNGTSRTSNYLYGDDTLPSGTYYYVLSITYINTKGETERTSKYNGYVELMR